MYRHARSFSAVSLQVVVSLALSGTLRADLPRPRSGALEDKVRHLPRSDTDPKTSAVLNLPGYALDYPQIIGDWAVCALWHGQFSGSHVLPTPQIRATRPALVAVNLRDGRTVQLSASDDGSADIDGLFPIGAGQCAVVISRSRVPNGKQDAATDRSLWKWTPATGAIVAGGRWTPERLLEHVVDSRVCGIATVGGETSRGATIRLLDIPSKKATEFFFDGYSQLFSTLDKLEGPPQTLVPLAGGRSFVLMHRTTDTDLVERNGVIAECVDPNAPEGRRWRLRIREIKEEVRCRLTDVYPMPGVGRRSRVVGFVVEGEQEGLPRVDCVTISSESGVMMRCWRIGKELLTRAVMSSDGKQIALVTEGFNEKTQTLEYEVSIVDPAQGTVRATLDLSRQYGVKVFAFEDATHLFGLSTNELWRFAIAPNKQHQLLFRLDPAEQN
jgi:hypothetical protein